MVILPAQNGDTPGADTFAESWAAINAIPVQRYLAQWNRYGRRAGILRNQQMLDERKPDLIVAFPTGGPGTKHIISIAKDAKIEIRIFHGSKLPLTPKPAYRGL